MNLKRNVTAETNLSRSVCMAYQSATDTAREDQMLQKSDADAGTATKAQMPLRYFTHAMPVPTLYFEIRENSSLPLEFDEYIVKNIEKFVEHSHISNARLLLSSIPSGISSKLDNWRRVLAIPKARPEKIATGVDIRKNSDWLRNNSRYFKGKWVALSKGRLIGSHERRLELHKQLKISGKIKGSVFIKIEKN
jgi:hypothetical protein